MLAEIGRPASRAAALFWRLRRLNHHHLGAFGHLRVGRDGDLGNGAVDRRRERVLHFHRLDDGEALAARDVGALLHQNRQYLAMHRRAHQPALAVFPALLEGEIAQRHLGLAAVAQHKDRVTALASQVEWSTRIYEDRRKSIRYVCEVPTLIEQRVFALGRAIKQALN